MLYFQPVPVVIDYGAVAAQVFSQPKNKFNYAPAQGALTGMLGGNVIPAGGPLIMSCGTDSFAQLKSPVRHSPKAIVLDVPSVMSRSEIAGAWPPTQVPP